VHATSSLSAFPFFSAEELEGLEAELTVYLVKATDVAPNLRCLDWWNQRLRLLYLVCAI